MNRDKKTVDWKGELDQQEELHVQRMYVNTRLDLSEFWSAKAHAGALVHFRSLQAEQPWREIELTEGAPYQIEGELGLWSFKTFRVRDLAIGKTLYDTRDHLPPQRGKARLRTKGAEELMLFFGTSQQSARRSAELFSRIRHQEEGVSPTTLRDFTEATGMAVAKAMFEAAEMAKEIPAGTPLSEPPLVADALVRNAMEKTEVPEELREEALKNPVPYTDPEETFQASADAVFCKKQKERRGQEESVPKTARKTVSTCCGTVYFKGKRLALVALDYARLAWYITAALRINELGKKCCCVLTDGERKLVDTLRSALSFEVGHLVFILDWYHLQSRCSQLLSMGIRGRELRNFHREKILRFLWYGCTQSALNYLQTIPDADVKNKTKLTELASYFLTRKDCIPVYAIRKQLGLPNSSCQVEKLNDCLVSRRQKGKGTSWSQDGSFALANVTLVPYNMGIDKWLDSRQISLELQEIAA